MSLRLPAGTPYSIYLHIPFCIHRCAYCDFNTYAGLESLIPDYTTALVSEIEAAASTGLEKTGNKLPVHTIFFGGGTPSLLPASQLEKVMEALHKNFDVHPGAEISLEANPGTVSLEYFQALHSLGFNRLSLGMQSADPDELRLLERQHGYLEVSQAINWARTACLDNYNLDLIFGLPYQTLQTWEKNLDAAIHLRPAHLSLYALTLEHGTPMQNWVQRGLLPEPDPDLAADMYDLASDKLEAAGFEQYEISNWARRDSAGNLLAARHNLQYWRGLPYLGLGAGAHGFAAGVRTVNVLSPAGFIQRFRKPLSGLDFPETPATVEANPVSLKDEIAETMMMGLRLTQEGVSNQVFTARFGESLEQVFLPQIERLIGMGLLEWAGEGNDILRLTRRGRLLGNQVFVEFI